MRRGVLLIAVALGASVAAGPAIARAATLEPVGSYTKPVHVTSEPQRPERLLVAELGGQVKLTEGSTTSTFLDVSSLIMPGTEEGLLSIAPAPDYATSRRLYVFYVDAAGDLQIDEFTADTTPVDLATRRPVMTIPHPTFDFHNGGQLQFGPDGHLYISTGDGGGTPELAQDTSSLLGKILRIDPDRTATGSYSVPPDNPFVGAPGSDEIWSYGLRNPFRFSFDRSNGAIAIGDVGHGSREEVDYEPQPGAGRGDNYGWNCREGFLPGDPACSGELGFTEPIHDYAHGETCSITGGYVVRDASLGDLYGRYVYADFCTGRIRSLIPGLPRATCDRAEALTVPNPSSFGEDASGRVYVASFSAGAVYRLVGDTAGGCPAPPGDALGPAPESGVPPDPQDPGVAGHPPSALRVSARDPQRLNRHPRLVCRIRADRALTAIVRLALLARGDVILRAGARRVELGAGDVARVRWSLDSRELRSLRGPLRRGALEARFRVTAGDAGGPVEAVSSVRG